MMRVFWTKLQLRFSMFFKWMLFFLLAIVLLLEAVQAPKLRRKSDDVGSNDEYNSQKDTGELNTENHQNAADQNSKDLCSHIEHDPKSKQMVYKLRELKFDGEKRLCCVCPPGTYLAGLCFAGEYNTTKCERCPKGRFVEEYAHSRTECDIESLTCPDHENYIYVPSNTTIGPRCYCNPEKPLFLAENGTCVPHSFCPPGQGVMDLGNAFHDTVCRTCLSGFESLSTSATEQCQPTRSVIRHRQNQQLFPTTGTNFNVTSRPPTSHRGTQLCPTTPSRHPEGEKNVNSGSIGEVAAGFVGAAIGAVVALLITTLCCRCYGGKAPNSNAIGEDGMTSSMELSDQKDSSTPPTPQAKQNQSSCARSRDSNTPRNKDKDQRKRNSEEQQTLLPSNSSASLATETMRADSEPVEPKEKAVTIPDHSSRGDLIHSTSSPNPGNSDHQRSPIAGAHPLGGEAVSGPSGLSNSTATNTTRNSTNKETLHRQLIEYCIRFLGQQSRHSSLQLEFDDVTRFCHECYVAVPTQAERLEGTPAQSMANAIRRDYDLHRRPYVKLLDQLRGQHLNTLADLLPRPYLLEILSQDC